MSKHRKGDVWVGPGAVRVVDILDSENQGPDLRVVMLSTGRGKYVEEGDLAFPAHLESVGFQRLDRRAYGRRIAEAVRKAAMEALPSSARRHADAISCIRLDPIIERVSDAEEANDD